MKLFSEKRFILNKMHSCIFLILILLQSCATHHAQYGNKTAQAEPQNELDTLKIAHTFFLIGDAGNTDEGDSRNTLSLLHSKLEIAKKNSTLLFLGDNIYPKGMPGKDTPKEQLIAEKKLTNQLDLSQGFKGKTIFIPGNHDWYNGIKGLERQEKFVTEYLKDKKSFLPKNACAIDDIKINDQVILITIDSQWFLQDWEKTPTINDNCDIKTKEGLFEELESLLNKNQDKIVILALHHPLMTNGSHGGHYSLKKQLFPLGNKIPLPVLGSILNFIRKTSGISPQDLQNKQYTILTKRIKTLLQTQDNVIVVSGHDHNLQFIENENIKQIISGAGSKSEAAKAVNPNDFTYGRNGFATLNVFENGAVQLNFIGTEKKEEKILFKKTILDSKIKIDSNYYPTTFPSSTKTTIYSTEMTSKSGIHNFIFGEHYRKYYSLPIEVKTAVLDTLFGGLTPKRAGGGHQSKSLQLIDKNGKEYAMRAIKKSVSRFLQSVAFKDQFVEEEFKNTYAENFLYDFYTTSHPYTPFAVGNLADKIGVSHSNPVLYYIPKQKALEEYNTSFGNELYMLEERPSDGQKDLKSFGYPDTIISTDDLLKKLQKDEKYSVDEPSYIKARLFDMLIGDWDRHYDQWRWGEYKEGDKIIYKPIPRDRDQAFSKYDGALLAVLMNIPALRHMQTFKNEIKNAKWFNREPYPLDLAFLKTATEADWVNQARYIQENLSNEDIDNAFNNLPTEVQDETIESIKQKLKIRKKDLETYASIYYKVLQKTVLIVGTNKKDKFIINRISNNNIEVAVYRIKKEGDELVYKKEFTSSKTKNLWIYGLDDDDEFDIKGNTNSKINIRLIGGQNHDIYKVENGNRIKIHDFKSKENTFNIDSKTKKQLTDNYETNLYDYKKPKYNSFSGLPMLGFNPDDGVKIGIIANYIINKFSQNPYTQKHTLKANYYFATDGFELIYDIHSPKSIGKWDFNLETRFTSPNFSINYFGYGNETLNDDDAFGMDYNRVRIAMLKIAPQFKKIGRLGSEFQIQTSFENIEIDQTPNRFISLSNTVNPIVFERQQFAGTTLKYSYDNYDNPSLPTLGMGFSLAGSWKINLKETNRNFTTLEAKLNFNHKIDRDGKIVLATLLKGKAILNNNFEFYQGATLGGDYDLRGFRNERFLGNKSFFQSSDLRFTIGKIRKNLIPMSYGLFGGYDYGRIWLDGETSDMWHQSVGGGLWLNGLNIVTARVAFFKSTDDDARISFGLGFGF
ncbi:metallophosphoesterase [Flavobacterium sp. K5-23]|uniref:metallophosphoesterase n=1 Tax=Flavobacterium sp. K5-23 TaxID=2746225 RepID=UPI00200F0EE5|nr:metallophosphoesterase [Flavobacterium sp. K5-23]UQD57424.1 metallophosphoesterase [Flavobacterium sp. K5-23]